VTYIPTPSYEQLRRKVQRLEKEALRRKQADEVLLKSEERYRMIFNYSPLGIVHFDSDGKVVDCNECFLEIIGAPKKKLIGFNMTESLRDERMRSAVVAGLSGMPNYFEGDYLSITSNKLTPVRAMFSRITTEDGRFLGAVGLFEDISDRKQSEEFLSKIANSISDPIYVVDRQHRYVLANDALCALAGRKREQILRRSDYDFFPKEQVDLFWEKDEIVFETGEENENEEEITDSNGVTRTVATKKTLYTDRHGNKLIVGIIRDITRRKEAELALQAAHRELQDIIEFLPDATFVIDREKKVLYWNRAMEEMTGIKKLDILGKGDHVYAVPFYGERRPLLIDIILDENSEIEKRYDYVQRKGMTLYGEAFVAGAYRGKGAYLWSTAAPLLARDGSITGFIQSIRDISDRKKAELELRLSEERFRIIFESAQDCIYLKDRSFKYALVNPAMERLFGIPAAQIIGHKAGILYGEEVGKLVEESDERVFAGEILTIERTKPIRNRNRTLHLVKVPIRDQTGEIVGLCGISRDITEIKQTENKLQGALDFLQVLMDTIPAPIFYKSVDGLYRGCNKAFTSFIGLDRKAIIGKSVFDVAPKDLAEKYHEMDTALLSDKGVQTYETSVLYADGTRHDVIFSKSTFPDDGGSAGIVGVILDITDLRRAEQDLKTSESRFQLMAESIQDVFWMATSNFKEIFYVNHAFEKVWKRTREELYNYPQSFINSVHPDDREHIFAEIGKLNAEGDVFDAEYRIIIPDGSVRWIRNRACAVRKDQGGPCLVTGVARDITERKIAEETLRKSESELRFLSSKLLAAQELERKKLAAELHDSLGSSLTAIKISIEHTLNRMVKGEAEPALLERSISLTQNTMEDVRRMIMDLRPSVLDDLGLIETVDWFCRQFKGIYPDIGIEKKITVKEDQIPDTLKIVIFRLLQEAFHNIGKYSKADYVKLSFVCKRGALELTIEDNGEGFDIISTLSRESGVRGLGLTSMKERTEFSGGSFSIRSKIGKGTAIRASWLTGT
jgi:PAS domain S-box-containing protein